MKSYAINETTATVTASTTQDTGRHTPRAAANHLSAAEQTKRDAANVAEDAAALDRTLAAGRRLTPPGRKPTRNWQRAFHRYAQTCHECGRSIEPNAEHYADRISGHLVRHVACHAKVEAR